MKKMIYFIILTLLFTHSTNALIVKFTGNFTELELIIDEETIGYLIPGQEIIVEPVGENEIQVAGLLFLKIHRHGLIFELRKDKDRFNLIYIPYKTIEQTNAQIFEVEINDTGITMPWGDRDEGVFLF